MNGLRLMSKTNPLLSMRRFKPRLPPPEQMPREYTGEEKGKGEEKKKRLKCRPLKVG